MLGTRDYPILGIHDYPILGTPVAFITLDATTEASLSLFLSCFSCFPCDYPTISETRDYPAIVGTRGYQTMSETCGYPAILGTRDYQTR